MDKALQYATSKKPRPIEKGPNKACAQILKHKKKKEKKGRNNGEKTTPNGSLFPRIGSRLKSRNREREGV